MLAPALATANPFARVAARVPAFVSRTVLAVAQLAGAAFAIYYAYDQDTLFPDRHFPRVWLMVAVVTGLALITLLPWERVKGRAAWLATVFAALGPSTLIYGGANLAQRDSGVMTLVAGVVALVALLSLSSRLGRDGYAVALGLFAGGGLMFFLSLVSAFTVPR